jgi:hypothetical protein
MFAKLDRGTASAEEPLPGWFARRRIEVPAAAEILNGLPVGAAIEPPASQARGASRDRTA